MLSGTPNSSWIGLELRYPAAYLGGKARGIISVISNSFLC